jgi:hypothetical protein
MADRLKPEVLQHLKKKTGNTPGSIRVQLSLLKRKFKGLTLNAAGQVYAEQHGTSILPKLTDTDKASLATVQLSAVPKREIRIPAGKTSKPFRVFFEYATTDKFEKEHIEEINRAYNAGCYTATYILSRKVIENLIIGLLKKKFPKKLDLYFDAGRGKFRDFSEVLKNISANKKAFDPTIHKAIERLVTKASVFKDGANDKTHSLFHIATKRELEDADVGSILALIASISATV